MTEVSDQDNKYEEEGEEQLAALIKEADEEARARKREAMDRHFEMLRKAVAEGLSRRMAENPKTSNMAEAKNPASYTGTSNYFYLTKRGYPDE